MGYFIKKTGSLKGACFLYFRAGFIEELRFFHSGVILPERLDFEITRFPSYIQACGTFDSRL